MFRSLLLVSCLLATSSVFASHGPSNSDAVQSQSVLSAENLESSQNISQLTLRDKSQLYVGQKVINIKRDYVLVTVMAYDRYNGTYVIRYEQGPLAGQVGGNWPRSDLAVLNGCGYERLCTGERVINIQRDYASAVVIAIQTDGRYVIRFTSGSLTGRVGGNWQAADFAKRTGCLEYGYCVGARFYNRARDYALVEIVGIQYNRLLVLRFLSGPLHGRVGGNWSPRDLVH